MKVATRFRVLCRPQTAAGFELIGLPVLIASDTESALRQLERTRQEGEIGLLLIEESLEATLPEEVHREAERGQWPVILPFPGPRWRGESAAEDRVVALLRRAIGYRVRL